MVEPNVPTGPNVTDTVTASYQYDDLNRLTSLTDTTASLTTLYSFTYTYRADGLRTSSTEQINGSTNTTSWTYDNLDRLTTATARRLQRAPFSVDVQLPSIDRPVACHGVSHV